MRTFISFYLNQSLLEEVVSVQQQLKNSFGENLASSMRFTKPEQMHITLKFLGETEDNLLEQIIAKLQAIQDSSHQFGIKLCDCGHFPERGAPTIIWLGIKEAESGLYELQNKIEAAISPLGFSSQFPNYRPHITISYVKTKSSSRVIKDCVSELSVKPLNQIISSFELMKSTLTPKGALHEVIKRFDLS